MKTRKYKDNQQRKNFAKSESNLLLIQYFKKMNGTGGFTPDRSVAPIGGSTSDPSAGGINILSDQKTIQISQYKK